MNKFISSWSGGKDSCYAVMQTMLQGYSPCVLLNVLNEEGRISRSHGIPSPILEQQAKLAGLPLVMISSSWNDYEKKFTEALKDLKIKYNATHAVFGDIDLQAHRDWEEMVCANAALTALLPIWKLDRKQLVTQMIGSGIVTMIVSCNEIMGESWIGRVLDLTAIEELETLGIDPCGENGEFHTLVMDCPLFEHKMEVELMRKLSHEKYWFAELRLCS
jgi:diphthine-ammonia ligase